MDWTRRELLKTAALAALVKGAGAQEKSTRGQRLLTGWEHYRGALGGIWEVWRGDKASDNVIWRPVAMPHCFNARDAVDPDAPYYQGPGWYRVRLTPQNPYPSGRTLLHFEGAGQRTEVYVNLEKVGEHDCGYDEFVIDITGRERQGEVPLAVLSDNTRDLESIPSNLNDFNLYGGLYRYVNLVYVPAISIERVHVGSSVDSRGRASVTVRVRLYNPLGLSDAPEISVRVLDPGGKVVYSGARAPASFTMERPDLWSPSHPALYRCEVTLNSTHGQTTVVERFGLRSFEFVPHGPFRLNGERLLLRGTQRHEDHAGVAAAMTEDVIRKEMRMIKDVGANFIRLGHYQQSRLVLDLCDELGLLVWEEIPWCRGGLGGERYQQQARHMLRTMIDQHYNHPSVVIWGLGNENDWPGDFPEFNQQRIRVFMQELNDLAHKLDPARSTAIRRCGFARDIPDVYSPSIWAGWYRGRYTEYKSACEVEVKRVNRFFHAEWGGDSHARRHSEDPHKILSGIPIGSGVDERGLDSGPGNGSPRASRDGDWSETYICDLFDWHLKEQETMPWLSGAAQWVFKDFSTPLRPGNPVPRVNQKGLVERDLTPKEGYYVFQSYWAEKPMARIYGHSWPVRWGERGEPKMVKVYSNCPVAELFLNGVSCGLKERDSQDFPAAGLRWMVKFQPGENHLRVVARKAGVEVTDKIRFRYQTGKWGAPARLDLAELRRDGDAVTLRARLLDAAGIECLDARNSVRFQLAGDGRLLDNLGTSTGSRVVELFNGRAQISLLRNGGASVIGVSSKGLPTVFLEVRG